MTFFSCASLWNIIAEQMRKFDLLRVWGEQTRLENRTGTVKS